MKIMYDAKVDGLSITFNDLKPNRSVELAKGIYAYFSDETIITLRIRPAVLHVDDVNKLVNIYIPKDAPYPSEIDIFKELGE